jgi:hypothetical protein
LRVISYHKSSLVQALIDLFPNIGINRAKFSVNSKYFCYLFFFEFFFFWFFFFVFVVLHYTRNSHYLSIATWQDATKRRRFFEDYAKANGFNPLKPENWYKHSRVKIMAAKVVHPLPLFLMIIHLFYFRTLTEFCTITPTVFPRLCQTCFLKLVLIELNFLNVFSFVSPFHH